MKGEKDEFTCMHAGCRCTVTEQGGYCSEACRTADQQSGQASTSASTCPCGHPGCG